MHENLLKKYLFIIVTISALLPILCSGCQKGPLQTGALAPPSLGEQASVDGCSDFVMDGLGDCDQFLADCSAGGGHVHATLHSGILAYVEYTCHPGREHRSGD
jgi:hypothetical protein